MPMPDDNPIIAALEEQGESALAGLMRQHLVE